ncbi:hypothetical protein ACCO45_002478 [Purpureocillium lilacinum]|uniref:Uncharacterized protein n=1 Tax=Purpureocillium lilacinum TaxID=33203 RepID=A0ACC4EC29_PURLI
MNVVELAAGQGGEVRELNSAEATVARVGIDEAMHCKARDAYAHTHDARRSRKRRRGRPDEEQAFAQSGKHTRAARLRCDAGWKGLSAGNGPSESRQRSAQVVVPQFSRFSHRDAIVINRLPSNLTRNYRTVHPVPDYTVPRKIATRPVCRGLSVTIWDCLTPVNPSIPMGRWADATTRALAAFGALQGIDRYCMGVCFLARGRPGGLLSPTQTGSSTREKGPPSKQVQQTKKVPLVNYDEQRCVWRNVDVTDAASKYLTVAK